MLQDESEEKGRSLRQSYRECKLEINYACIRNVGQLRWCCAKLRVLKDVFGRQQCFITIRTSNFINNFTTRQLHNFVFVMLEVK